MAQEKPLKIDRWWASHFGTMLASVYLVLAISPTPPPLSILLWNLGLFTLATLGIATFAYLLNDLMDAEQDARTGVWNLVATKDTGSRAFLFVAALAAGIAPWWWLPTTPTVAALVAAEYVLFVIYSCPPVRLKERGVPGVVADALYAYVVPNAFSMLLFDNLCGGGVPPWVVAVTLGWCFWFGVERIVHHQLRDANDDERSGARTFVVGYGWSRAFRVVLWGIVPAMAVAFLAMLVAWGTISPVVPVAFALHAALVTAAWRSSSIGDAIPSHRVSSIDCYHVVAERLICTFVWRWLGLAALAALVTTHPQYLPLVPVHLLMFRRGIVWAFRHELSEAKGLLRAACQC